jgi:hypothetical protein
MITITEKTKRRLGKRLENQANSNTIESRNGKEITPIRWIRINKIRPKQQGKKAHLNLPKAKLSILQNNYRILKELYNSLNTN